MRTVTFQSVYAGVLRRRGLDPLADTIDQATARTIAAKIQRRARIALRSWNFLEWSTTEERAFRTIWNDSRQFYRSNPLTGKPDELFYIPGVAYYKVLADAVTDPPVGTLPTNTAYFEPLTIVDTYLELDQACRHSIGRMLGVFSANPRLNGCGRRGLKFRPSEKGIDVYGGPGPTVFINYMLPEPHYTKVPYITGKTYGAGDRVFQGTDGNVYRARTTTTNPPPNTTDWALEPVLEVLADYAEAGSYSDWAKDPAADTEASALLELEIDALQAQGQSTYYNFGRRHGRRWCASQPWTGGTVTELTDECQGDFIFPTPSPAPTNSLFIYAPEIATADDLHGYTTADRLVSTMIVIFTGQHFRLAAGAADPDDPGQKAPDDYNLATNNKHWEEVL